MLDRPQKAFDTALRRAHAGDQRAALRILDELLDNNPYYLEARAQRALMRYFQGLYSEAAADVAVVLQVHPNDDDALALSGDCHLQLGNSTEASRFYLDAIQRNPRNRRAIGGLAMLAENGTATPSTGRSAEFPDRLPGNLINVIARLAASITPAGDPLPPLLPGVIAYTLVRSSRPDSVLDLGVLHGFLALVAAQALEHEAHGKAQCVSDGTTEFFGINPDADLPGVFAIRQAVRTAGLEHRVSIHQRQQAEAVLMDFVRKSDERRIVFAHTDSQSGGAWNDFITLLEASQPGVTFVIWEDLAVGPKEAHQSPIERLRTGPMASRVAFVCVADLPGCRMWVGDKCERDIRPSIPAPLDDSGVWQRWFPRTLAHRR